MFIIAIVYFMFTVVRLKDFTDFTKYDVQTRVECIKFEVE